MVVVAARPRSAAVLALASSALLLAVAAAAAPSTAAAFNIVFILSESLDGRLLRDSSPAKIPHIRALAARGVRFDSAYANSPVCGPSRSSLWSGRPPHAIPHEHNGLPVGGVWNNWEGLPDNY